MGAGIPLACIFNITYKLKHVQFQLTRNENCEQRVDQASVCLVLIVCFQFGLQCINEIYSSSFAILWIPVSVLCVCILQERISILMNMLPLSWYAFIIFLFLHAALLFIAWRYCSVLFAVVVCPSVWPSICHKPVLYRNDWMNKAGFWHGGSSETVEFVDDAYTTVNKSWLFATSRSAVTL